MACPSPATMDRMEEMPCWSTNQASYKVPPGGGHYNTSGNNNEWGSSHWGGENTRKRYSRKSNHQHQHNQHRRSHEAAWPGDHRQTNTQPMWTQPQPQPQPPVPPPPTQPQPDSGFGANFQEPQGPIPVFLENLPHTLCRQNFLEAMLDQAGLVDEVLGCVLGNAKETGMAQITLANWNAAVRCVAHFDGRSWDQAGNPVRASISEEYLPQPIPSSKSPKAANSTRMRKPRTSKNSNDAWKMGGGLVLPPSPTAMPLSMPVDMSPVSPGNCIMLLPQSPMSDGGYKVAQFMPELSKTRWADVVEEQVRYDDHDHFEKGSTSAGSSGRGSRDTNGDCFPDFACDTDDGF